MERQLLPAQQETVLRAYLAGEIDFEELAERLSGHLLFYESISDDVTEFSVEIPRPLDVTVVLTPAALRPVLEAHLRWELDDAALARWATVLLALDAFENPPGLSDEEADELMDPLWEALWDLSRNFAGHSVRDRVQTALADLAELEGKLTRRAHAKEKGPE